MLKNRAISAVQTKFTNHWQKTLDDETSNRLQFYKAIKNEFKFEEYLTTPTFEFRKAITKIRCSDHPLEVEKGRHRNIPRENRICKLCPFGEMETEEHFLTKCIFFDICKHKHDLQYIIEANDFINNVEPNQLGGYLTDAFSERKDYIEDLSLG